MQSNSSNADITSNFSVISYPQWIGRIHLLTYNDYLECQDEQCDKKYFLDFLVSWLITNFVFNTTTTQTFQALPDNHISTKVDKKLRTPTPTQKTTTRS
jgi:hypothetical protein